MIKWTKNSRTRFSAECVSRWNCVCVCRVFFALFKRARNWWMSKRNMSLTVCMVYALKITLANHCEQCTRTRGSNKKPHSFWRQTIANAKTNNSNNNKWLLSNFSKMLVFRVCVCVLFVCARAFALLDFSTIFFFFSLVFRSLSLR